MKVLEKLRQKRLRQLVCDHEWAALKTSVREYRSVVVYKCKKCGKMRVE